MKWVQLSAGKAGALNPVVLNGAGFTLYRFDKDTPSPSKSNCSGDCAKTWPPVLVDQGGKIFLDGVDRSAVGVVKRDDGTLQVTIGGWPVYRFSKDQRAGDTNGQGVGGTWFGVRPDGKKAQGQAGGTGNGANGEGGVAVVYTGKNLSGGAQAVTGPDCQNLPQPGKGLSLRLVGGPVKIWSGPKCTGDSTEVSGDVADLSALGFGNKIASIKFGVAGNAAPQAGSGDSVIAFDDKNFSDTGAAQGISGPGCQDLARPGVTSSLRLNGGPVKIWSAPKCTGESSVVSADVPDLGAIGFDNKIASIRFGVGAQ
jgi:predicted lipoprotein with Yx(FWY)xxD motif